MNTVNIKVTAIALLLSLAALVSTNVTAASTISLENSLSELLLAQSEQVMDEVSQQLQTTIAEELNSFSIDFSLDETIDQSLAWLINQQGGKVFEKDVVEDTDTKISAKAQIHAN